jgi:anti-sigma regulatory factor (Ser/Thr protein kinase)
VPTVSRSFPAQAASVPTARRFVRTTLAAQGLAAAWDAAELLVSEVVTNAVLHARTEFVVQVLRDGDLVRVSVHDRSPVIPMPRAYGTDSTTGRGMRLVATLAVAWGVERDVDGKAVWFEVSATGGRSGTAEPWAEETDVDALLAAFDDMAAGDRTGGVAGGGSAHAPTSTIMRRDADCSVLELVA